MVSNKEYYAPVLEEGDSFAESKEKFDAATSSQSPQELKGESDSSEGEKDAPSESPAGKEFYKLVALTQLQLSNAHSSSAHAMSPGLPIVVARWNVCYHSRSICCLT